MSDVGAASVYDVNSAFAGTIERVEVRAFGCLLEDVLGLVDETEVTKYHRYTWQKLINDCTISEVKYCPSFSDILAELNIA
ncbi:hypothetical protein [Maribacter antarcticus]|uniref:hypothetical protein n=1 Tax=Maribacter antarcticus TaxID=505250 RepID=UPI00047A264B|nr:hypothetical protein [Maribacter antarcticus]